MLLKFLQECLDNNRTVIFHLAGGTTIPCLIERIVDSQWIEARNREYDAILIPIDSLIAVCRP